MLQKEFYKEFINHTVNNDLNKIKNLWILLKKLNFDIDLHSYDEYLFLLCCQNGS